MPAPRACALLFAAAPAAALRGGLRAALDAAGAGAFEGALRRAGADAPSDVELLTDADLRGMGMTLVQARRLQRALKPHARDLEPVTFGSAGKAVNLQAGENELYNHTCSTTAGVCVMRHMWFGGKWSKYDITRLRVYVDGEAVPSIDGQMFLMHGIGYADDAAPWSSGGLFGKTGSPSGVFNTFQIPFSRSVRVTAQCYADQGEPSNATERFWWIFRGTEGEPGVTLGDRTLPPAARLRLHTNEGAAQPALSQLSLAATPRAGAVLMTVLSVGASSENFLEGEVRTFRAGAANDSCSYGVCSTATLSSGTEDYFLGTYYFNKGTYHNALAGLSHLVKTSGGWQFSAYRRHDGDYLLFPAGGFNMTWRCGEPGAGHPTECTTFSYTYVYEW